MSRTVTVVVKLTRSKEIDRKSNIARLEGGLKCRVRCEHLESGWRGGQCWTRHCHLDRRHSYCCRCNDNWIRSEPAERPPFHFLSSISTSYKFLPPPSNDRRWNKWMNVIIHPSIFSSVLASKLLLIFVKPPARLRGASSLVLTGLLHYTLYLVWPTLPIIGPPYLFAIIGWQTRDQSPTFSFEFVPIPRPYPSTVTHAHPCLPMLFKLHTCIKILCNVHYPPTPSLGWIRQIKGGSMSLASARSASWLSYSLHPRILTPIWSWMQGCTKLMPTHAYPWTITSHPCPPKTHGYGWAWAWACVWAPNVGLC